MKANSNSFPELVEKIGVNEPPDTTWSTDTPLALTTTKWAPELAAPVLAVTTTLPVLLPVGTVATMLVSLQLVIAAGAPLNVTEPDPWEPPKLAPSMVTGDPGAAKLGCRPLMPGGGITVKLTPLLATPPAAVT
jgi:hypothetical protein